MLPFLAPCGCTFGARVHVVSETRRDDPQPETRTPGEPRDPQGAASRPATPDLQAPHRDEPGELELFRAVDRIAAAVAASASGGISPTALWLAYSDWLVHFARSPGKQAELVIRGGLMSATAGSPCPAPNASWRQDTTLHRAASRRYAVSRRSLDRATILALVSDLPDYAAMVA